MTISRKMSVKISSNCSVLQLGCSICIALEIRESLLLTSLLLSVGGGDHFWGLIGSYSRGVIIFWGHYFQNNTVFQKMFSNFSLVLNMEKCSACFFGSLGWETEAQIKLIK